MHDKGTSRLEAHSWDVRWLRRLHAAAQVDQAELETVLPAPGGAVVVVKGPKKGAHGEMLEIDVDAYRARVALQGGEKAWFEYEDICKAAPAG
jgi:hypothetical protein